MTYYCPTHGDAGIAKPIEITKKEISGTLSKKDSKTERQRYKDQKTMNGIQKTSENQNQKPEVQMLFSQIKTGLPR